MKIGEAFITGRSREHARRLLEAAEAVGMEPTVVLTATNGYVVPVEVADEFDGKSRATPAAEAEEKPVATKAAKKAPRGRTKSKAAAKDTDETDDKE